MLQCDWASLQNGAKAHSAWQLHWHHYLLLLYVSLGCENLKSHTAMKCYGSTVDSTA